MIVLRYSLGIQRTFIAFLRSSGLFYFKRKGNEVLGGTIYEGNDISPFLLFGSYHLPIANSYFLFNNGRAFINKVAIGIDTTCALFEILCVVYDVLA